MVEQRPLEGTTQELIEQARARRDALSQVEGVLSTVTGTAQDADKVIEVTVDARGKLRHLRLAPAVAQQRPEQLGPKIVEVAQAAMQEATQNSYNRLALQLGEDTMHLIEQLSGVPAPARSADDDPGLTVEEFQRRQAERLRAARQGTGQDADVSHAIAAEENEENKEAEEDEVYSFDPATLRSDR